MTTTPTPDAPCGVCGHPLARHAAQPEGLCLDCPCFGWTPDADTVLPPKLVRGPLGVALTDGAGI